MVGSKIKTFFLQICQAVCAISYSLKNQPRQLPWMPWWWWRPWIDTVNVFSWPFKMTKTSKLNLTCLSFSAFVWNTWNKSSSAYFLKKKVWVSWISNLDGKYCACKTQMEKEIILKMFYSFFLYPYYHYFHIAKIFTQHFRIRLLSTHLNRYFKYHIGVGYV